MRIVTVILLATAGASLLSAAAPADRTAPLKNGVYAVMRECPTRDAAQTGQAPERILVYDRKYEDADKDQPPRYVALDTSSFVPLVLAGPPATERDSRGWTMLRVTLTGEQVKALENLTRAHLGGSVAIVIDSEIITIHKVRSVIQDGKAQITRCSDDACQTLRLKLAK